MLNGIGKYITWFMALVILKYGLWCWQVQNMLYVVGKYTTKLLVLVIIKHGLWIW